MEKTLDKARFFAQYWGQKAFRFHGGNMDSQKVGVTYMNRYGVNGRYLLLKPLSLISDEDAIEAAKIMYPKDKFNGADCLKWGKEIAREILEGQTDKDVIWFAGILPTIDYLRSKSYALPFMQYSVNQLIEMGWIKLSES